MFSLEAEEKRWETEFQKNYKNCGNFSKGVCSCKPTKDCQFEYSKFLIEKYNRCLESIEENDVPQSNCEKVNAAHDVSTPKNEN